uniref:Tetraspanin-7 n=1 Tax=Corvus moneduloides TaxID=1196302 RepID=A0A8C3DM19_CORMO
MEGMPKQYRHILTEMLCLAGKGLGGLVLASKSSTPWRSCRPRRALGGDSASGCCLWHVTVGVRPGSSTGGARGGQELLRCGAGQDLRRGSVTAPSAPAADYPVTRSQADLNLSNTGSPSLRGTINNPDFPADGNAITGVILLAVGVWGKLTLGTYISLIAENSTNAPYVLIGTGTTIIVFGLFGCFATCRGSPWMLKLYAMFLSLVFLAELVAGISGFVFRHEIKDTFLRTYTEAIQNYNKNDERSHAVDNVQESLSCCGIQSYTNWSTSPYFFKHGIPTSCCMNSSDCNTQDLRNMTVAATKVNQKALCSLCVGEKRKYILPVLWKTLLSMPVDKYIWITSFGGSFKTIRLL